MFHQKSFCFPATSSRWTSPAPKASSAVGHHVPLVAALRPGILTYARFAREAQKIVVLRGFAEVSAQGLTVLADVAEAVEDIDRAMIAQRISELESRIEKTELGSDLDKLITRSITS